MEVWSSCWAFSEGHVQQTTSLPTSHFIERAFHEEAQFLWRVVPSQCSLHQDTGPCLSWGPSCIRFLFSEFSSNLLFVNSSLKTGRPWSVFCPPFHPFTPSHHCGAKWIQFSKYSSAARVLGLLMSDGNCSCYFPKWKSTSEEQLVCCNVLLPPITSSIPTSQSKPSLDCFICEQGLWDALEECADGREME